MTGEINKLFVYGTLLQGESRSHYLDDCKLIQAMEVPGKLYDTGRGYPAALFDGDPKETVAGEIYSLCGDTGKKLRELDEAEGTTLGLYRRKDLTYKGHDFYLYEIAGLLQNRLKKENRINGSWRRHGSTVLNDPVEFALNFEGSQQKRYGGFPPENSRGLVFLRGEIPVLLTAPHATRHLRMGKLKYQEEYTGALSVILHALTGSYALYTHWASNVDPNFYDGTPFKEKLAKVVRKFGIRFVLDMHGTRREWSEDIYPGIGNDNEFLLGNNLYFRALLGSAVSNGLTLGGLHVFPALRQMTVTKFVAKQLNIPSMQIEINERLRHPESKPSEFEKLVSFLANYICSIKTYL